MALDTTFVHGTDRPNRLRSRALGVQPCNVGRRGGRRWRAVVAHADEPREAQGQAATWDSQVHRRRVRGRCGHVRRADFPDLGRRPPHGGRERPRLVQVDRHVVRVAARVPCGLP